MDPARLSRLHMTLERLLHHDDTMRGELLAAGLEAMAEGNDPVTATQFLKLIASLIDPKTSGASDVQGGKHAPQPGSGGGSSGPGGGGSGGSSTTTTVTCSRCSNPITLIT